MLLTFLGGGVFGNLKEWIEDAIVRSCVLLKRVGLRVLLVHYRSVDPTVVQRIDAKMAEAARIDAAEASSGVGSKRKSDTGSLLDAGSSADAAAAGSSTQKVNPFAAMMKAAKGHT